MQEYIILTYIISNSSFPQASVKLQTVCVYTGRLAEVLNNEEFWSTLWNPVSWNLKNKTKRKQNHRTCLSMDKLTKNFQINGLFLSVDFSWLSLGYILLFFNGQRIEINFKKKKGAWKIEIYEQKRNANNLVDITIRDSSLIWISRV